MPSFDGLSLAYYAGDAAATAPAARRLKAGLPLNIVALGTSVAWSHYFLRALNRSVPAEHALTHVVIPQLELAPSCIAPAITERLGASAHLLLFEPGLVGAPSLKEDIEAAEILLRGVLGAMRSPAGMVVFPDLESACGGIGEALIRSPVAAVSEVSHFYGLPSVSLRPLVVPVDGDGGGGCSTRGDSAGERRRAGASADVSRAAALGKMAAHLLLQRVSSMTSPASAAGGASASGRSAAESMGSGETWKLPSRWLRWERNRSSTSSDGAGLGRQRRAGSGRTGQNQGRLAPAECSDGLQPTPCFPGAVCCSSSLCGSPRVSSTGTGLAGKTRPLSPGGPLVPPAPPAPTPCQAAVMARDVVRQAAHCNTSGVLPEGALLQRSRVHEASAGWDLRWGRVLTKLEGGQPVKVAVLGGSLNLNPSPWHERVVAWMRTRWPSATVSLHNGAIGGTGSAFFALCADSELPADVDLVFLEHAQAPDRPALGGLLAATALGSIRARCVVVLPITSLFNSLFTSPTAYHHLPIICPSSPYRIPIVCRTTPN